MSSVSISPAAAIAAVEDVKPASVRTSQIDALHGLRFFAAFCILFSHACTWLPNFSSRVAIFEIGEVFTVFGMPLFFVLSGFVIHYSYGKVFATMRLRWAVLEFAGARFARLYPLYITFILVGIATDGYFTWIGHHRTSLIVTLFHDLTLTQSWAYVTMFADRMLLQGPYGLSWSISTEVFFYVFYIAFALPLMKLRNAPYIVAAGLGVAAVAMLLFLLAQHYRPAIDHFGDVYMGGDVIEGGEHSFDRWLFYFSPYSRIFEFILGCLTAQLFLMASERPASAKEERLGRHVLIAALVLLAAFALVFSAKLLGPRLQHYVDFLKMNFGCALPIACVIFCVARYPTRFAGWVSCGWMVALGGWSYSIYTVHTWTLRLFQHHEAVDPSRVEIMDSVLRIVVAIALTILISAGTYRLIEVPARQWLRGVVARGLQRPFGPRAENRLARGAAHSTDAMLALVAAFLFLLVGIALYQFKVVPIYEPFTY